MNRRDFLRGIASVTAAGILLPGDEIVRRFWRGWTPANMPLKKGDRIGAEFVSDPRYKGEWFKVQIFGAPATMRIGSEDGRVLYERTWTPALS